MSYPTGTPPHSSDTPRTREEHTGLIVAAIVVGLLIVAAIASIGLLVAAMPRLESWSESVLRPSCPEIPAGWTQAFLDDFSSADSGYWEAKVQDDENGRVAWNNTQGSFYAYAESKQGMISYVFRQATSYRDFYLNVDARQFGGTVDSSYGVVFHTEGETTADRGRYYFFISETQEFSIWRFEDQWTNLASWTYSDAIDPAETNHLMVMSQDSLYSFCVNGKFLDQFYDSHHPAGSLGFAIWMEDAGDQATYQFDNLEVYAP